MKTFFTNISILHSSIKIALLYSILLFSTTSWSSQETASSDQSLAAVQKNNDLYDNLVVNLKGAFKSCFDRIKKSKPSNPTPKGFENIDQSTFFILEEVNKVRDHFHKREQKVKISENVKGGTKALAATCRSAATMTGLGGASAMCCLSPAFIIGAGVTASIGSTLSTVVQAISGAEAKHEGQKRTVESQDTGDRLYEDIAMKYCLEDVVEAFIEPSMHFTFSQIARNRSSDPDDITNRNIIDHREDITDDQIHFLIPGLITFIREKGESKNFEVAIGNLRSKYAALKNKTCEFDEEDFVIISEDLINYNKPLAAREGFKSSDHIKKYSKAYDEMIKKCEEQPDQVQDQQQVQLPPQAISTGLKALPPRGASQLSFILSPQSVGKAGEMPTRPPTPSPPSIQSPMTTTFHGPYVDHILRTKVRQRVQQGQVGDGKHADPLSRKKIRTSTN